MRSIFQPEDRDKNGNPKPTITNFLKVMQNDRMYAGIFFNEMLQRAEIHGSDGSITRWSDADEAQSMCYIEEAFGLYSKDKHAAALRILFDQRKYNPIKDMIDDIVWDGQSRCTEFLIKWGLAEDTPYTREVSRLIFAGGIHRLYAPGTKFDDVPILMGGQGCGKSTLVRFLAMHDDYYGEVTSVDGQPAIEQLSGKWICEMSEMLALTKSREQEAVKAYITRAVDSYRKPWDKNVSEFPRRCIIVATSNNYNMLVDKSGNRRYYPHHRGYQ